MAIKITPEPNIHITRSAMEHLMPEYQASQWMTTRPVSFETWLRQRDRSIRDRLIDAMETDPNP